MSKFVGAKNGKIKVVSDTKFKNDDLEIVEISGEMAKIAPRELVVNYKLTNGKIVNKSDRKDPKDLKIAFVTNYKQACGISTYFENLLGHLENKIGEYKLFTEINTESDNKLSHEIDIREDKIIACWQRGQSLEQLTNEIKKYNPDIVLINHEWGLFSNSRFWLAFMTQLSDLNVITVMHSIFPNHADKIIVEASLRNVIVHSEEAKEALLTKKGINNKINVIPHGCYENSKNGRLWNFYKSKATFMQMGFGFQYKNFEACIKTAALLKPKYPDVFFTALFSESPHAGFEHESYYNSLMELIEQLNLKENVGIIRGFQSDIVVDAYLRTNRVAVFPYRVAEEHLVFGASGAARLAMSKNIPVISSIIPHFSDLPTIKAVSPEEVAMALDELFSDEGRIKKQIEKQNIFIEQNSWERIADKYLNVFSTV